MENPAVVSLLRQASGDQKRSKSSTSNSLLRMFKLFPMLSSGCKMVALLGRPRKALLAHNVTTGTLYGHRRGKLTLSLQDDPQCVPTFIIELPILTTTFHKEIATGLVRLALESETKTSRKKVLDEYVWGVYCNGRKTGYSIRRKHSSDDELYVMQMLRGVSMGAGVLPCPTEKEAMLDGELTYLRGRFERVVGSKDSEAFYMINPDGGGGPELSIFVVRVQ